MTFHAGDVVDEEEEGNDPTKELLRAFVSWHEYAAKRRAQREQASEVTQLTTRRINEWLESKKDAMTKIKPAQELKALLEKNLHSRGPLEFLKNPASPKSKRPPPEAVIPAQEPSRTAMDVLLEDWPQPKPGHAYKLHLWSIMRSMPESCAIEVMSSHGSLNSTAQSDRTIKLPGLSVENTLDNISPSHREALAEVQDQAERLMEQLMEDEHKEMAREELPSLIDMMEESAIPQEKETEGENSDTSPSEQISRPVTELQAKPPAARKTGANGRKQAGFKRAQTGFVAKQFESIEEDDDDEEDASPSSSSGLNKI